VQWLTAQASVAAEWKRNCRCLAHLLHNLSTAVDPACVGFSVASVQRGVIIDGIVFVRYAVRFSCPGRTAGHS
jgi:hypothetical protein